MKSIIYLLIAVVTAVLFFGCKKGQIAPGNNVAGTTFSETKGSGYSPEYKKMPASGPGNTFLGDGGTPVPDEDEDDDEDDDDDDEEEETASSSLNYKSTAHSNVNVTCQSSANYYGVSGAVASASVICTLYLPAKPTANGSLQIEEVTGSKPAAGKVWLVVTENGKTFMASSGYVYVTVNGNAVTADFSSVTVSDGTSTESVSGTLICK
jgi:hypothetical protein